MAASPATSSDSSILPLHTLPPGPPYWPFLSCASSSYCPSLSSCALPAPACPGPSRRLLLLLLLRVWPGRLRFTRGSCSGLQATRYIHPAAVTSLSKGGYDFIALRIYPFYAFSLQGLVKGGRSAPGTSPSRGRGRGYCSAFVRPHVLSVNVLYVRRHE